MGVNVVGRVWWPRFHLYCCHTHIFVVLLQVDKLLSQGLDFTLQVEAAQVGVVNNFPQTHNISLHRLPDGQLRLIPDREKVGYRREGGKDKGGAAAQVLRICPR